MGGAAPLGRGALDWASSSCLFDEQSLVSIQAHVPQSYREKTCNVLPGQPLVSLLEPWWVLVP